MFNRSYSYYLQCCNFNLISHSGYTPTPSSGKPIGTFRNINICINFWFGLITKIFIKSGVKSWAPEVIILVEIIKQLLLKFTTNSSLNKYKLNNNELVSWYYLFSFLFRILVIVGIAEFFILANGTLNCSVCLVDFTSFLGKILAVLSF